MSFNDAHTYISLMMHEEFSEEYIIRLKLIPIIIESEMWGLIRLDPISIVTGKLSILN